MQTKQIADAVDQFAHSLAGLAANLRAAATPDYPPNAQGQQQNYVAKAEQVRVAPVAQAGAGMAGVGMQRADDNRVFENTMVQVPVGDLWRLVNRARKMIRLAREGKVPSQQGRAPLCRAIKALKQQGLVKKPYNLRD